MTVERSEYVPCEACGLYVPPILATFEPQSGGHLCNACVRAMTAKKAIDG